MRYSLLPSGPVASPGPPVLYSPVTASVKIRFTCAARAPEEEGTWKKYLCLLAQVGRPPQCVTTASPARALYASCACPLTSAFYRAPNFHSSPRMVLPPVRSGTPERPGVWDFPHRLLLTVPCAHYPQFVHTCVVPRLVISLVSVTSMFHVRLAVGLDADGLTKKKSLFSLCFLYFFRRRYFPRVQQKTVLFRSGVFSSLHVTEADLRK